MTQFTFPDKLSERLQRIAERENRSVADVVEAMADHYEVKSEPQETSSDPFLMMLEMAEEEHLTFSDNNVVDRSREILNTEYAEYLLRRMHGDDATD